MSTFMIISGIASLRSTPPSTNKILLALMMLTKGIEAARNPRHFPESALELSKTVNASESTPKLAKAAALKKLVVPLIEVHATMEVGL